MMLLESNEIKKYFLSIKANQFGHTLASNGAAQSSEAFMAFC